MSSHCYLLCFFVFLINVIYYYFIYFHFIWHFVWAQTQPNFWPKMSPVLAQILACQNYKQTSSPGHIALAQDRPTFEAHCTQFAPTQRLGMWDPLLARSRACLALTPPRCRQASSALVSMAPISVDQIEPPKCVPCGPITLAWPLPTPNQLLQPPDCSSYGKGVDRKSTRLNSSHFQVSRMPSSA